jgi:hypothetical protein
MKMHEAAKRERAMMIILVLLVGRFDQPMVRRTFSTTFRMNPFGFQFG